MAWHQALKFRLSTLMLLAVVVAIALGWYLDHAWRNRTDPVGTWYNPNRDPLTIGFMGIVADLEIREDGTFTQEQTYVSMMPDGSHPGEGVYRGEWSHVDYGMVLFRVTSIVRPGEQPEAVDLQYYCHCAINREGDLIIFCRHQDYDEGMIFGAYWPRVGD